MNGKLIFKLEISLSLTLSLVHPDLKQQTEHAFENQTEKKNKQQRKKYSQNRDIEIEETSTNFESA